MDLVNMQMSAKEAKEYASPATVSADAPKYPYGLRLELNDDALDKLGLDEMPKIGATMMVMAKVEVCGCSAYSERDGDTNKSLSLQITDLALSPAEEKPPMADRMYKKSAAAAKGA